MSALVDALKAMRELDSTQTELIQVVAMLAMNNAREIAELRAQLQEHRHHRFGIGVPLPQNQEDGDG